MKIINKIQLVLTFVFFLPTVGFCRPIEIGIAALSVDGNIPSVESIENFEHNLGVKLDVFNWFIGFNGDTGDLPPFPLSSLKNIPDRIIPMLTWEPWADTKDNTGKLISPFVKINSGALDEYIKSYANLIKKYGKKIRLRFGHEMIQDDNPNTTFPKPQWYPWQDYPEDYKKAYIRIFNIFLKEGVKNVEFVWAINFEPYFSDVISKYYPGPQYVNWIGIDGYNWAGQDFDGVFKKIYINIVKHPEIYGDKPIMLSEIGASKAPENKTFNKANWIMDAFEKIDKQYPKIQSIYWFNVNKERDWRLDETPESWKNFQDAVHYIKNK